MFFFLCLFPFFFPRLRTSQPLTNPCLEYPLFSSGQNSRATVTATLRLCHSATLPLLMDGLAPYCHLAVFLSVHCFYHFLVQSVMNLVRDRQKVPCTPAVEQKKVGIKRYHVHISEIPHDTSRIQPTQQNRAKSTTTPSTTSNHNERTWVLTERCFWYGIAIFWRHACRL